VLQVEGREVQPVGLALLQLEHRPPHVDGAASGTRSLPGGGFHHRKRAFLPHRCARRSMASTFSAYWKGWTR